MFHLLILTGCLLTNNQVAANRHSLVNPVNHARLSNTSAKTSTLSQKGGNKPLYIESLEKKGNVFIDLNFGSGFNGIQDDNEPTIGAIITVHHHVDLTGPGGDTTHDEQFRVYWPDAGWIPVVEKIF